MSCRGRFGKREISRRSAEVVRAVEAQLRAGPLEVNIAGDVDPAELDAMLAGMGDSKPAAKPAPSKTTTTTTTTSSSSSSKSKKDDDAELDDLLNDLGEVTFGL